MILSDLHIAERIMAGTLGIDPCRAIGPASVDLYLSSSFVALDRSAGSWIENGSGVGAWHLRGHSFVLACTQETITLPDDLAAQIHGCSSIGRTGLFVQNAGWVDPGFSGQITLELYNATNSSIPLVPGMRIAQIAFSAMTGPAQHPYAERGRYQGQRGATAARQERA